MRRSFAPALVAVLSLASVPAASAADGPLVHGVRYSSWTEYFRSAAFVDGGLRCGTRDPFAEPRARAGALDSPSDCSLDRTVPSDDYAPSNVYVITVVIHRLESATGDGVFPDSLVRTQMDVLNEDFRALAGTPGAPGADTRIQFRLATVDPEGRPTTGWTRTTNEFWFNDLPDPVLGNYWDQLAWDPTRYLNIYTLSPVAPGGLILGYVPFFPQEGGAGTAEDGVRCLWSAFGRTSANAPYDQGRTVTHEVGHYVGLYHVFQDGCGIGTAPGCYSTGDRICDTEPDAESHGGCPVNSRSCNTPDPIRNYMEYTDDACMTNFTPEQARRMRCTLRFYRPTLYAEQVVAVETAPSLPEIASLAQNRPNPFISSTEIAFELPVAGRAEIEIHDVAGRLVRTLAAGERPAGAHRVRWDGADAHGARVQPGVYFYRLRTDGGVTARRLTRLP